MTIRTAAPAIALFVAFFMAVIGSNFTHRSPVYSVLGGVSVTVCAGLCVAFFRVSKRSFLGALCGVATLCVGFVGLGAHWASIRRADQIAQVITYRFLPIVAVIALVIGLIQLPWRAAIHVAVLCVGPLFAGLSSMTPNIAHVQLAATVTLIAGASALLNLALGPHIPRRSLVLFSISLGIILIVMCYAIAVSVGYDHYWPSTLLAWSYILAAFCAFIAALIFDGLPQGSAPVSPHDGPAVPPAAPVPPQS
ncbi:MAG: hypothetical protein Q3972_04240 [Corynebacterium sp.]|nr:hypothetical protein [Corynebacterium sp.]